MAKKKPAAAAETNKSDVIRQILTAQPSAKVKEIQAKLDEKGVKASVALINKIKYGTGSAKKSGRGRKAGAASKAGAIRAMFTTMGHDARPRDVIAALKAKGVVVTSAQVSMLRSAASNGNGNGNGHANGKSHGNGKSLFSLDQLLVAKQLAERMGGIPQARQALDALAQLA